MGNVTVGYFLIWLTHLIWHVVLLFSKLSFLILSIPISYLSGCRLPTRIISGMFFVGLILMLFLPFESPFHSLEHRLRVTHLYEALETQLFREMCPPIIDDNYQRTFRASIMENYSTESIFLFCIYENESRKDENHEQIVKPFIHDDEFDKLSTNECEKQRKGLQRNVYNCLPELKTRNVESLGNADVYGDNDDEELQNTGSNLNNNRNKNENGDENSDKRVESKSDVLYSDKIIGLKEEKSSVHVELSGSNIEHSQVEETDMINETRSLVEEKALESNGICNAISEISHDKIIDNPRKLDANESIPECIEQVEKVIAVINADSLSDNMENYGNLENCSKEVGDEDLIAVINILQSDGDSP